MKYDDLLDAPYRHGGRDKNGFDCYGLAIECARRDGKKLRDLFEDIEELDADKVSDYIKKGLNVREIPAPKVGCIVGTTHDGKAHIGYLVARNTVIHATRRGVRTSPLGALRARKYYEVTDEGDNI